MKFSERLSKRDHASEGERARALLEALDRHQNHERRPFVGIHSAHPQEGDEEAAAERLCEDGARTALLAQFVGRRRRRRDRWPVRPPMSESPDWAMRHWSCGWKTEP